MHKTATKVINSESTNITQGVFNSIERSGLNKLSKQRVARELCSMNKIEMCVLSETKLNKKAIDDFVNKFFKGWKFFINLDAHDGCRILLLYRSDLFEVNVRFTSIQLVHCDVKIMGNATPFSFSVVYGLKTMRKRLTLWEQLSLVFTTEP